MPENHRDLGAVRAGHMAEDTTSDVQPNLSARDQPVRSALCSPPELADHIRFASLFGPSHYFRASYLACFEDREAIAAMDILAAADEVVSTGD